MKSTEATTTTTALEYYECSCVIATEFVLHVQNDVLLHLRRSANLMCDRIGALMLHVFHFDVFYHR